MPSKFFYFPSLHSAPEDSTAVAATTECDVELRATAVLFANSASRVELNSVEDAIVDEFPNAALVMFAASSDVPFVAGAAPPELSILLGCLYGTVWGLCQYFERGGGDWKGLEVSQALTDVRLARAVMSRKMGLWRCIFDYRMKAKNN